MVIIHSRRRLYLKNLKEKIRKSFKGCEDFKMLEIGNSTNIFVCFFNCLIDQRRLNQDILKPITDSKIKDVNKLKKYIQDGNIYDVDLKEVYDVKDVVEQVLTGNTAIILEDIAYIFETKGFDKRSIQEPTGEKSSKGSKDSFIEVLATNLAMVRRRTATNKLKVEMQEIGEITKTSAALLYIEGEVDKEVLKRVKEKINNLNIPALTSLSEFEENIVDSKYSMYPQFVYTERPDKLCSNLLEGKIGIIIDGYSVAYIVPGLFPMFMQATEEYSTNYVMGSLTRFLRYICLAISLILPGLYVSITTFHQEMIPTKLAQAIINSKQDVPFPAFLEIIIMLIAFEILLEAGARMPQNIGQTVSIVGGLIIGEAAVNAKFVSPAVVVVVAAAGVCGFLLPNQDLANATRINRMILVLSASVAGLFGISVAIMGIVAYLSNLDSFGVPYLKPFVANENKGLFADTMFRGVNRKTKDKMRRW